MRPSSQSRLQRFRSFIGVAKQRAADAHGETVQSGASQRQSRAKKKFFVELIKPSHYDDDGYVIQWVKSWIPSNSLACLYGLTGDAIRRQVLGEDVEIVVNAYDECNTVIPIKKIIQRA